MDPISERTRYETKKLEYIVDGFLVPEMWGVCVTLQDLPIKFTCLPTIFA